MGNLNDFLSGIKILEEKESSINGKLTVVKDLAWGIHIKGGGLTQSGGVAEKVWNTSLKKVAKKKKHISNALILGLGGGSIAKLIRKYWPASSSRGKSEVEITGVDIDPVIVELGERYMDLDDYDVNIQIKDAERFIKETIEQGDKYDLICVDVYVQTDVPEKFKSSKFVESIKKLLNKDGIAVFNRLYYDEKRKEAEEFSKELEKVFEEVEVVHPEANIMYLCLD